MFSENDPSKNNGFTYRGFWNHWFFNILFSKNWKTQGFQQRGNYHVDETIGFLIFYCQKRWKHDGFNSVVITTLMKPLCFQRFWQEHVKKPMVSSTL